MPELIDADLLHQLAVANKGRRGYLYTHYDPFVPHNREAIKEANRLGLTVNLSADSLEEADQFVALQCGPVVVTVPADWPKVSWTPEGNKVVICPEQTAGIRCVDCAHKMCANPSRTIIVGFRAHGVKAKALSIRLKVQ